MMKLISFCFEEARWKIDLSYRLPKSPNHIRLIKRWTSNVILPKFFVLSCYLFLTEKHLTFAFAVFFSL